MKDFEKEIAGLEKKWDRTGAKLESIGSRLTTAVSLPLAAAGFAAVKMSTDFETALTKVRTIAGESAGNIGTLKQAILDLAPTVGIGPTQLAEALLVVESTGIRGQAAIDVLTASAKASAVGLGETTDVARAVTAAVTAYGAENLTAARAADVLFQTVVAGGAEANQLAGELGRVVGVASNLGVSFEEVGAFIATYTRLGLSAAEATTGLSGVLNTILSPSKEARDVLEGLGLSADSLRAAVKDKGLGEALIGLIASLNGNADATGALFGNVRALAGVLGTAGTQAQAYRQNLEDIRQSTGALDRAFVVWQGTTAATWAEFTARVKVAGIALGDELAPAFSKLLQAAQPLLAGIVSLVSAFGELPQPVQTGALAFGALAVAIGPVTYLAGSLLKAGSAVLGLLRFLVPSVTAVTGALTAIGPAIAVAGAAFAGLKIGSLIADLRLGSLAIGDWVEFLAAWRFGLAGVSAENVKLAISARKLAEAGLPGLPASPALAAGGALPVMPIGIDEAFNRLGQSAEAAAPKVKKVSDEFKRLHEDMLRSAIDAERAVTSFEFFQQRAALPLQTALAGLGVRWTELTEAVIPTRVGMEGLEPILAHLGDTTVPTLDAEMERLGYTLGDYGPTLEQAQKEFQSFGDFLKNDLGKAIISAFQGGGNVGRSIGSAIGGFLTGPNGVIGQAVSRIGGTLGSVLGSVVPGLGTLLGGLAGSGIGRLFGNLFGSPERQINPIRQAFVDAAGGLDQLNQRAAAAGVTLTRLLDARTPEQYRLAIEALQSAFEFQDQAMQTLDETTRRYGFTLEELGPALQRQALSEQAQQLYQDFSVLTAAGIDTTAILTRMSDGVNAFVANALRTGTEVPAAMRPMLEQFVNAGLLFDQNGQQITDLGESGLTFAESMSQGFTRVVESVQRLTEAIARGLGLSLDSITQKAEEAASAIYSIPSPTGPVIDIGAGAFGGGDGLTWHNPENFNIEWGPAAPATTLQTRGVAPTVDMVPSVMSAASLALSRTTTTESGSTPIAVTVNAQGAYLDGVTTERLARKIAEPLAKIIAGNKGSANTQFRAALNLTV